ncbi:MAG: site-specific integrase [Halioglobus sp.]
MAKGQKREIEVNLRTPTSRKKLPADNNPYFERVTTGVYLGFRRSPGTGAETWLGRYRKDSKNKQIALGNVADLSHAEALEKLTKDRNADLDGKAVGKGERGVRGWTVARTVDEYIEAHKDAKKNPNWARNSRMRANNALFVRKGDDLVPRAIAKLRLVEVEKGDIQAMQRELAAKMEPASINRTVVVVRAAINWAVEEKKLKIKPLEGAKRAKEPKKPKAPRAKFPIPDCIQMIEAAPDFLQPILRCQLYTGCRPVGARRLVVEDVDLEGRKVWFTSLKGDDNQAFHRYYTSLSDEAAEFFADQIEGKEPTDPVFTNKAKQPWQETNLSKVFRNFRKRHEDHAKWKTMYSLRHSVITYVLLNGMTPSQAAEEYDTSLEYIEKNYNERNDDRARAAVPSMRIA